MGILDGIVEWIAEQVMNALDLITTSVLGALGCSMDTFLRYFPAAEDMYEIFVALALGLVLLNWIWQLFKNYFAGIGVEAEDPIKLSIMTFIFIFLIFYANDIVNLLLDLAGTPYSWILSEDLPPLEFGSFNSVITVILGVCANGAVAIIALILVASVIFIVMFIIIPEVGRTIGVIASQARPFFQRVQKQLLDWFDAYPEIEDWIRGLTFDWESIAEKVFDFVRNVNGTV